MWIEGLLLSCIIISIMLVTLLYLFWFNTHTLTYIYIINCNIINVSSAICWHVENKKLTQKKIYLWDVEKKKIYMICRQKFYYLTKCSDWYKLKYNNIRSINYLINSYFADSKNICSVANFSLHQFNVELWCLRKALLVKFYNGNNINIKYNTFVIWQK